MMPTLTRLNFSLASLAVVALSACSSTERSRALDDSNVKAPVIAMQVCANCHGVTGVSTSPNFPHLAGQTPAYLTAQLKSFKTHGRSDPAGFEYMWGLSARLSDEQISGLADYFSAQKPAAGKQADTVAFQEGKKIFESGIVSSSTPACATCHGAKGEGMGQFPSLAGQHADYVVKQLMVFQRTDERPEGSIMKNIAHGLSKENMENIAAYLQAIPLQK